jgi:cyclopropane fatty-acyl-phospholipid synthase-like methyltransferase
MIIHHSVCPACSSNHISASLSTIDYTVTKEQYTIYTCKDCSLRFTQDIPTIEEIGKYYQSDAYVSHSDTKKGLINTIYHKVRRFTLQQKQKLISQTTGLQKGRLLDIGAGTGAFANTMQQAGWEVKGLEPDETAREQAQKNYNLSLDLPQQLYSFESENFDAITMWHVLEHVHDLNGYWEKFAQILASNGRLVIAVPNYTSYDAKHYGEYWAAYDVPRHLYHFSPHSIEQLGKRYGFKLEAIQPMWFDAVYVSMLSEQYKNGRSNLLAALWHGLYANCKALFNKQKCSSLIYIFRKY